MSKRNKYKFQARQNTNSETVHSPAPVSNRANVSSAHAAEYRIITNDLVRLVILNGVMLAAVVFLYYTNKSSGYLERFFERFI